MNQPVAVSTYQEPVITGPVNQGMPPIVNNKNAVSRFEFWPAWLTYTPVALQSLGMALRYRSLTLPLIANPGIHLSGMVGESKTEILNLAGEEAKKWVSPFISRVRSDALSAQQEAELALDELKQAGLSLPVVVKPDIGCRGFGVRLIDEIQELEEYLELFPEGARYLLQEKAPYRAEAGLFYIRYPGQAHGKVYSITLKYSPSVVGDGKRTLQQLIQDNPRASQLAHLYERRHPEKLQDIIPQGEEFQLAFAGSHTFGCIFRDGNRFITDDLARRLDQIFDDFPGFHFGRLDVKFKDINALMAGEDFTILEVNGASSEAGHIWDSDASIFELFKTLLYQYRTLFEIGHLQREAGHRVPTIRELLEAWKIEKAILRKYPTTD